MDASFVAVGVTVVAILVAAVVLLRVRANRSPSAVTCPAGQLPPRSTLDGMPQFPGDVRKYKETRMFSGGDVPRGLLARHTTAENVWGLLKVVRGRLRYRIFHTGSQDERGEWPWVWWKAVVVIHAIFTSRAGRVCSVWTLDAGSFGVIPPQLPHRVELLEDEPACEFRVEFWKHPTAAAPTRSGGGTGVPLRGRDFAK